MPPAGYPAFLQYLQSGRVSSLTRLPPWGGGVPGLDVKEPCPHPVSMAARRKKYWPVILIMGKIPWQFWRE